MAALQADKETFGGAQRVSPAVPVGPTEVPRRQDKTSNRIQMDSATLLWLLWLLWYGDASWGGGREHRKHGELERLHCKDRQKDRQSITLVRLQ